MQLAAVVVLVVIAVVLFVVIRQVLASSPRQGKGATVIAVCVAILCAIAMSRFLGIGSTSSPSATTAPATQEEGDGLGFVLLPYAALAISLCFLVLLVAVQKVMKRRSDKSNADDDQARRMGPRDE